MPRGQAPDAFTAAQLGAVEFDEEPPPASEPRPIDDRELLALLDEAGWDMVQGKGPFLSVVRKGGLHGYTSVYRFGGAEEARKAYLWAHRWYASAEFLEATGEYAQRPHEGCSWWCLPPWSAHRPKAWRSRFDPRKRAEHYAERTGDVPDVDRARSAILRRCEQCAACAREAGEAHLAKLRKAQGEDDRVPLRDLLRMPMDLIK